MSKLKERKCAPCEGGTSAMNPDEIKQHLGMIDSGWKTDENNSRISRSFEFDNYYQATAFINAVAWIAHREDHHPDISFGYKNADVSFSTHAIGGLSENDFICAAKLDALLS